MSTQAYAVTIADAPPDAVRIDRATKWGNPFKIGIDGTRDEVIAKYREYILGRPDLLADLPELKGKALACWCAPKACHGDVLAELANALDITPGTRVRIVADEFPVYIGEYGTITRAFERRHGSGGRLIPATSHNLEVTFDLPANGFSGRWYRPEDVERIV